MERKEKEKKKGGICFTKSISQKSTQELNILPYSHHKVNPETGKVIRHGHSERHEDLKRKMFEENVQKVKGGGIIGQIQKHGRIFETRDLAEQKVGGRKDIEENQPEWKKTKLNKIEETLKGYRFDEGKKGNKLTTTTT